MNHREEVEFVLTMLAEGKVKVEEAQRLLEALSPPARMRPGEGTGRAAASALGGAAGEEWEGWFPAGAWEWKGEATASQGEDVLDLREGDGVCILNNFGSVSVVGEDGTGKVRWEAAPGAGISIDRDAGGVKIAVRAKPGFPHTFVCRKRNVSCDLTVTAPPLHRLEISSVSADITVTRRQAGVNVKSVSGEVTLREVEGEIFLKTVSGDVSLHKCSGPKVEGKSVSGDARAEIEQVDALKWNTVSGDLSLSVSQPFRGRMEVGSISGGLDVSLHPESDVRVEFHTTSGTLSDLLGLNQKSTARRGLSGLLGEGKGIVRVSSTSGDITLERGASS